MDQQNGNVKLSATNSDEELFARVIALPLEQQLAAIEEACLNNVARARRISELVECHRKNESHEFILDRKPDYQVADLADFAAVQERVGSTISRYKLLEKIGEGGMGDVYMAEQVEGVRRRVALKIIKLGMDTRQVIARFEAERQAMALFDHPCITRVFDAGSTESGRPYFVMELVRGKNIVSFVNSNQLTLEERLGLFVDICHAVQHAHQKGIIHRDLKPSNILVTLFDGVPVPKVIDFGIAKAIGQQRLTEKTLFTRYSAMVGTPQYMSPEQAELNGMDVDTRSDIYSLGVLLYELITDTTPITQEQLKQLNPINLHQTLQETEIEAPSTRLARVTSGENTAVKALPALAGSTGMSQQELDWVVMKALSRDRTQRYATANELAGDIKRYLQGDSVLAMPPSPFYKFRKLLKRNRAAIISTLLAIALLLSATAVCAVFAYKEYQARQSMLLANQELVGKIDELELTNQELEKTKAELREKSDEQIYRYAISIAEMKFLVDFQDVITEEIEKLYPGYFETLAYSGAFGEPGDFFGTMADPPSDELLAKYETYDICLDIDRKVLLDIPFRDFLKLPLARIQRHFEREEEMLQRFVGELNENQAEESEEFTETDSFEPSQATTTSTSDEQDDSVSLDDPIAQLGVHLEHQHTDECLQVREQTSARLKGKRHLFFRYVVDEYRKSFGDNDKRVAEALNMLAAALINAEKFSEAEAYLREAISMGGPEDVFTSETILNHVRSRKYRLKK